MRRRITVGDAPLSDHLAAVARQRKAKRKASKPEPKCPRAMMPLWRIWTELDEARGSNGFGPNPISYGEMYAYCRLTDNRLSAWEVSVLRQLDLLYLQITSEAQKNG